MDEARAPREPTEFRSHGIPVSRDLTRTSPNLRWRATSSPRGYGYRDVAFLPIRDNITPLSKGFAYLAVVVAAAATGSSVPAWRLSAGVPLLQLLLPAPYNRWMSPGRSSAVLFAFLALSVIISELFARAAERAGPRRLVKPNSERSRSSAAS